jgi:rifampicin phosphotransferase
VPEEHRAEYDRLLGTPDAPPPPPEWMPQAVARINGAMFIANQLEDTGHHRGAEEPEGSAELRGTGARAGRYEGPARIVRGPEDFHRIQAGDVLVAEITSPAFNVVLPLLGALVTDQGGLLCHTAIVAREYGIPAVVGTRLATTRIPDGARIAVDGLQGRVEILSPVASGA